MFLNDTLLREALTHKYKSISCIDSLPKILSDSLQLHMGSNQIYWFARYQRLNKHKNTVHYKHGRMYVSHVLEYDSFYLVFKYYESRGLPMFGFKIINKQRLKIDTYGTTRFIVPKEPDELIKAILDSRITLLNVE
jgi:hypothetical protein